jgi:hypothetical protein
MSKMSKDDLLAHVVLWSLIAVLGSVALISLVCRILLWIGVQLFEPVEQFTCIGVEG